MRPKLKLLFHQILFIIYYNKTQFVKSGYNLTENGRKNRLEIGNVHFGTTLINLTEKLK